MGNPSLTCRSCGTKTSVNRNDPFYMLAATTAMCQECLRLNRTMDVWMKSVSSLCSKLERGSITVNNRKDG